MLSDCCNRLVVFTCSVHLYSGAFALHLGGSSVGGRLDDNPFYQGRDVAAGSSTVQTEMLRREAVGETGGPRIGQRSREGETGEDKEDPARGHWDETVDGKTRSGRRDRG